MSRALVASSRRGPFACAARSCPDNSAESRPDEDDSTVARCGLGKCLSNAEQIWGSAILYTLDSMKIHVGLLEVRFMSGAATSSWVYLQVSVCMEAALHHDSVHCSYLRSPGPNLPAAFIQGPSQAPPTFIHLLRESSAQWQISGLGWVKGWFRAYQLALARP